MAALSLFFTIACQAPRARTAAPEEHEEEHETPPPNRDHVAPPVNLPDDCAFASCIDPDVVKPADDLSPVGCPTPTTLPRGWTRQDAHTARSFKDIIGFSPTDVWAVGEQGLVVHWDGCAWRPVDAGTTDNLHTLWASRWDNLWAAGTHSILRWDGTQWRSMLDEPGTTFQFLSGTAQDDVWVATDTTVRHWDGATWSEVWKADKNDWILSLAAGRRGELWLASQRNYFELIHLDQGVASLLRAPLNAGAPTYVAASDGVLWGGFGASGLWRWDGQQWIDVDGGLGGLTRPIQRRSEQLLLAMPGDFKVRQEGGARLISVRDGKLWRTHTLDFPAAGGWASSPDDLWVVGAQGAVSHWGGALPDRAAPPDSVQGEICANDGWCWLNPRPTSTTFQSFWGLSDDDLWAAGEGGVLLHWNGVQWTQMASPEGTDPGVLWGTSNTDLWLARQAAVFHWDGVSWTRSLSGVADPFLLISGASPSDVWVTTASTVHHWNGRTWSVAWSVPAPSRIVAVAAASANALWIASYDDKTKFSALYLLDATGSKQLALPVGQRIFALWSSSTSDLWVGGQLRDDAWTPVVNRWDGTQWTELFHQGDEVIFSLAGQDPQHMAMAIGARVLRWDGQTWIDSGEVTRTYDYVTAVHLSGNRLWAATTSGTINHWDGLKWNGVADRTRVTLNAVWASGPADVWAVGEQGTVLHWDGQQLITVDLGTSSALTAVSGTSASDVWIGTTDGTAYHWNGTTWELLSLGLQNITALQVLPSGAVWSTGYDTEHHCSVTSSGVGFCSVEGEASLHQNGVSSITSLGLPGGGNLQLPLWAGSSSDSWATSFGTVKHWDGSSWKTISYSAAGGELGAVFGFSAENVWMASMYEVLHWDGRQLVNMTGQINLNAVPRAIWGSGSNDVWIGAVDLWHWNGSTLTKQPSYRLRKVYQLPNGDVWAVGGEGTLMHRKATP